MSKRTREDSAFGLKCRLGPEDPSDCEHQMLKKHAPGRLAGPWHLVLYHIFDELSSSMTSGPREVASSELRSRPGRRDAGRTHKTIPHLDSARRCNSTLGLSRANEETP